MDSYMHASHPTQWPHAPGWETEEKETWFRTPSVSLIPESLSQCEHITELSGILVFKETYFSCKSAPKYKPIAYLVLKETAIHSNFAGNMAVLASMTERVSVGLPDGAF